MTTPETNRPDRRRLLAGGVAIAALAGTGRVCAQTVRRIGVLTLQARGSLDPNLQTLEKGLGDLGYRRRESLALIERYADGRPEALSRLVAELLAERVELIIAQGAAALHLKRNPPPVPVVFVFSGDPIAAGLAESLALPPARMTGVTFMAAETSAKRLELLAEIVPGLKRFALIANPEHPGQHLEQAHAAGAAAKLGVEPLAFATRSKAELDAALERIAGEAVDGVIVFSDTFALVHRAAIAAFGLRLNLPVIGGWEVFARDGFLLTYGPNRLDAYRRVAAYVDRILKGARPADLPIEQPTRFALTVNLTTARAIRREIPPAILLRADEVIE